MDVVRVSVVDDHPITRDGFAGHLAAAGFAVVASAAMVEDPALDQPSDVVVCDLHLPGRSGGDAVAYLVDRGAAVLASSGVAKQELVLDAVAAGANGFVSKTAPAEVIVDAVSSVAAGRRFVSPELATYLAADARARPLAAVDIGAMEHDVLRLFQQGSTAAEVAAGLGVGPERLDALLANVWDAEAQRRRAHMPTARERELIRLVALGVTHREIATRMVIATATVPDYLKSIKAKFLLSHPTEPTEISPRAAASQWANELGLL